MTVPSTHPPFAHELLIAQLAVQRAVLVTKRVLATINAADAQPQADPATPCTASPVDTTAPVAQFLHPEDAPPGPAQPPAQLHNSPTSPGTPPPPPLTRRISLAKPDTSPVTIADLAAQALLTAALHAAFPRDRILGEEDASALRRDRALAARVWALVDAARLDDAACDALLARPRGADDVLRLLDLGGLERRAQGDAAGRAGRVWCMDPIDGTSAFLQGGQYAVSLALMEGGREVVGVLACPNWRFDGGEGGGGWRVRERVVDRDGLGLMLAAVRGHGATVRPVGRGALCEGRRVERERGKAVDLREVHFVDSPLSPASLTEKVAALARRTGAAYPAGTQIYSSHVRYAAMVLGGPEFVQLRWPRPGSKPWSIWDHAGSQLIYTESGAGKVTDLSGSPIDFTAGRKLSRSWGLLTADESIHGEILALVKQMRAEG